MARRNRKSTTPKVSNFHVEKLETRLLFSADAASLAGLEIDPIVNNVAIVFQNDQATLKQSANVHSIVEHDHSHKELLVTDVNGHDLDKLIAEFSNREQPLSVVVLDVDNDVIEQLGNILEQHEGIDTLHIVSQESGKQLKLAGQELGAIDLLARANDITQWRQAFSADAELMIHGNDMASGTDGRTFVDALAALTGADVQFTSDAVPLERFAETNSNDHPQNDSKPNSFTSGDISDTVVQELVIIDSAVPDIDAMLADLQLSANVKPQIVILDNSASDAGEALMRISHVLEQHTDLQAVHLISHGSAGELLLAGVTVDNQDLLAYSSTIAQWSHAFATGGDFLIYGCDLAAGSQGEAFVETLSFYSGTDVAASTDLTGGKNAGGNWLFEKQTGFIERSVAFSDDFQQDFEQTFATYTVSTLDDSGAGSLREAITLANGTTGTADVIEFSVAGTITLSTVLPNITDAINIDGTTSPGYIDTPVVTINGAALGDSESGLVFDSGSDGSVVRGLSLVDFNGSNSAGIVLQDSGGHTIESNYLGTDGSIALANWDGIQLDNSSGNTIGGATTALGNLISGNYGNGISISGVGSFDNTVLNNRIGTNADGTSSIANISGVYITSAAYDNTIGGSGTNAGNLISGNDSDGVFLSFAGDNNVIAGNTIGLAADGSTVLENIDSGILINSSDHTLIGADGASYVGNVISGNSTNGIFVIGASSDTTIAGNFIGTDANGELARGNGSSGIRLSGAGSSIIGGSTAALSNTIAGNGLEGILLFSTQSHSVLGNYIGTNSSGITGLGNTNNGIKVSDGSSDITIGGSASTEQNTISNNGANGIVIEGTSTEEIRISGNRVSGNGALGVDLNDDGVTLNDSGDADTGPNSLQNSAVINSASIASDGTFSYELDTTTLATGTYSIDFYASTERDAGRVEGERFIGSLTGVSDGNSALSGTLSGVTMSPGEFVTLISTDASGNSSEFSTYAYATDGDSDGFSPENIQTNTTSGGGLSINDDGGNDIYLVADDGDALLGEQTSLSFETQFSSAVNLDSLTLLSYATPDNDNEVVVEIRGNGEAALLIQNSIVVSSAFDYNLLRDGDQHSLGFTWDGSNGNWAIYADGVLVDSTTMSGGSLLANGLAIEGGGTLLFGQEQDSVGGGFSTSREFTGTLFNTRIFDGVRTDSQMNASFRSQLPFNEPGMLAQWDFKALSFYNGAVTDSVSGNNLTIKHSNESGFVASVPLLTLTADENAINDTVVGSVSAIDPQREALISDLLAADSDLHYSAKTYKFYKPVSNDYLWSDAQLAAESSTLNTINGQLVTIRSAAENAFVASITNAASLNTNIWLGATDSNVEGEWRWVDDGAEADLFWRGDENGYSVNNAYNNFDTGQPNDLGGAEDAIRLELASGKWFDGSHISDSYSYVVEWDADSVLDVTQVLSYSLESQDIAGAFEIDSDTGSIRVLDGTLLDADTQASHSVTVRVTDVDSNTYDQAFTITLNDLNESNSTPTNLSSGIELNSDGGNDAYLIADDGTGLLGGLSKLTIETQFALVENDDGLQSILSYRSPSDPGDTDHALKIQLRVTDVLDVELLDQSITVSGMNELRDGQLHTLAFSWDNTNGEVWLYIDGVLVESDTAVATGQTMRAGGELVLGHVQQTASGGFAKGGTFRGTLYDVRVWDEVRSEAEISLDHHQKLDLSSLPSGLIANWQMDGFNGSNEVVDVVSANNLSIGDAGDGGDWIESTPVEDLHISENANNGDTVGFVVPSDPEIPQDVVSDGLFLNGDTGTRTDYTQGQTFGGWTVESGAVSHTSQYDSPNGGVGLELQRSDGDFPSSITQSLETVAGRQYQLIFNMTGSFSGGDSVKHLVASAAGESTKFTAINTTTYGHLYEPRSMMFTAESASLANDQALASDTVNIDITAVNDAPTFTTANPPTFTENVISTSADEANDVVVADVDGDGDMDVLSASLLDDKIAWYENDGGEVFTEWVISTNADSAISLSVSDVDGDGDMDVLSASKNDDNIAWYENDGSEVFTERVISTTANGAAGVSVADVDGDGDLDVLSASVNDDKIAWYENDGGEVFTEQVVSTTADGAHEVVAADVDGDGDLDVLSASQHDDKIAWYENDGSEVFTERVISTTADYALDVVVADVDGDGDLDVLSASRFDDKIAWYENDGSEVFTEQVVSTSANGAVSVNVADVDGDGDLDVLSASRFDDKIAWYENDGSEVFTERVISTTADFAHSVNVADVDGDGDLDVLSASQNDDKIAWYENSGQTFTNTLDGNPTFIEDSVAVALDADVDVSDEELDALNGGLGDYDGASVTLGRNGGANAEDVFSFTDANGISLVGGNTLGKSGAVIASFDGVTTSGELVITFTNANGQTPTSTDVDNILRQITYANSSDNPSATAQIDWAFNDGNTSAQGTGGAQQALGSTTVTITAINDDPSNAGSLPSDISVTEDVSSHVDLSAVDFSDADAGSSSLKITLITSTGGNLTVAAGSGMTLGGTASARTFTGTLTDLNAYFDTASNIQYVHGTPGKTGDNADTIQITLNDIGNTGSGGGTDIDLGTVNVDITAVNDSPSFNTANPPTFTENVISTTADRAQDVVVADVDGDGDMDVLSASEADDKIAWYENDGSEVFTERVVSTTANGARSVRVADVDSDGDLDVLSASRADDKIAWYENDGSEVFTERVVSTTADGARSVSMADIDSDGDLDVLSASVLDDKIAWYENDGSEVFTERVVSTTADNAIYVTVSDVDGDGDMDVLSASYNDDKIAWYENDGSEVFTERVISTTADGAVSVSVADVDGDGDLDVLSASEADNKIAWYENDGSEVFTESVISTTAYAAVSVNVADVDGDGDLDVLFASRNEDKIAWYENDGSEGFTERVISTSADGARSLSVADVDGDGDLDVLSASLLDDKIAWYENSGQTFTNTLDGNPTFIEDGVAVVLDADVDVSDEELDALNGGLGDYDGASVTLGRNGGANAEDIFSFTDANGITLVGGNTLEKSGAVIASFDGVTTSGELVITFTNANGQTPTSADVDNVLRQITYANSSDNPSATAQIDWAFNDGNTSAQGTGGAQQALGSTTVTITAINDDPSNAGSLPSDISVVEDISSHVDLSAVDYSDVDAGSSHLKVTLTTSTGGQLTLAADGTLSFGGTDSARTVTGTVADLNAYFDVASNVQYIHGTANTNGNDTDTIQVLVNDQGNTGSGGGTDQILGTVNVDITAVNDEQDLTANTGTTVAEGSTGTTITTAMLQTTDVDNTVAELVYTINSAVVNGTLRLSGTALILNDTFTQADIDAGDVSYDHDGSQTSSDSFAFTVDDGVGTDSSATFNFTVTNINDAPVAVSDSATAVEAGGAANAVTGTNPSGNVLSNDTDEDTGDTLSVVGVQAGTQSSTSGSVGSSVLGSYGSISINSDGSYSYVVDNSTATVQALRTSTNTLSDTFSYTMEDASGAESTTQITLTVQGVNDAPDAIVPAVYLSDLTPLVENNILGNLKNDESHTGVDVILNGVTFPKAIATQAPNGVGATGHVDYAIEGATDFKSSIGITSATGSVIFRVYVDNALQFTSATLTGSSDTVDIHIDTTGGTTLRLEVDNADDTGNNDHAVWANARFEGGSVALAVNENASNGVVVGSVNRTDVDWGDNATYTLVDDASGRFVIDTNTGEITVADGSLLDYETAASHSVVIEGSDGTYTTSHTLTVAVVDVVEPAQTVPGAQSLNEDQVLTFSSGNGNAVTVSDGFAGTESLLEVTLSVNDGALNLSGLSGISIVAGANDSGNFTIHGTESDINAALEGMTFTPDADFNGSVTLNMSTSSRANLEANYTFETASVSGSTVNDQSVGGANPGTLNGNATIVSDAERGDVLSLDGDGDYVEINGLLGEPANVTLAAWVDVNDNAIGEVVGLGNNTALRVNSPEGAVRFFWYNGTSFNALASSDIDIGGQGWVHIAATFDDLNNSATLYVNGVQVDTTNTTDSIAYDFFANDTIIGRNGSGGATQEYEGLIDDVRIYSRALSGKEVASLALSPTGIADNVDISVAAVNDEEVLATNTGTTVAEGSTGTVITAAMLSTTDVDNTAAQLLYTIDTAVVNGTLRLSGTALGLNDTFTQADIDAGDVSYDHDGSQTSSDSFVFTVDDGTGTDTSGTFSITVTNVNDAPENTVPGAQTVDEDTPLAIAGISVADDDDNLSAVQLTVNNGALSVTLSGTASISAGANDSSDLTLSGSLSDINAALATVSYQGDLNYNGSDTLTLLSTDTDSATISDTVSITVNAVNDNPANAGTLPSDVAVTEDVSSNVDLSSLNLSDVDAGSGDLIVTLATATGGQLSLAADVALSFGGTDSARTVTGTVANLNAYFDVASNVQYVHGTANTNGNDADTIQVVINDQGNTGSGGGTNQDLGTVNVDITAVNDAPSFNTVNPPTFTENVISTTTNGAYDVVVADVDGDGDLDVLSASYNDDKIAWYENDGSEVFTERVISTTANGAAGVSVADVDGDGDLDVLSASVIDDKIAWHENDGGEVFSEQVVSTTADGAHDVVAADVDGDGDLDVLSASEADDKIAWYENDGSEVFSERVISTTADGARNVIVADVDGDGDLDVLSASFDDDKIAWYENDGSEVFTERVISTTADGARSVSVADVDGDGDLDVLSASRFDDKIAWYENDGSEVFTERVISTTADGAHDVVAADVDGDGDLDVLSASRFDDKVAWYENDGSEVFTERVVSNTADSARSVSVADVDGDGDLDVLSASRDDDKIAWYENSGQTFTSTLDGNPTFIEDGAAVVLDADVDVSDEELDALNGGLGDYDGASVTLGRNGGANAEDVFSFTDANGITLVGGNTLEKSGAVIASFDGVTTSGELVITFTNANGQTPTSADVDNILRQITYANSSDTPPATAQIDWAFNDGNTSAQGTGGAQQALGSTTVTITAINDDPSNAGSLPSDISVTEDVSSQVDLSAVDFSDADAGSSSLTVTLTTGTGGQLSLAADGALSFGGSETARTISGTLANLNAYFDVASNVQYVHGTTNTNGNDADTIQVVINDQGNTGSGGGTDQALGTVNVDITAVNDEQVLVTNAGATVAEGSTGTVITAAMLNTTDVDNTAAQLVYTIDTAVVNGTLRLSGLALGLNDTFTQADVDAGDVSYDHDDSQTSSDAFAFTVDDGTGTDTSGTFSITVTNVNDAPENTVPGAQTVDEDTPLAIAGISVADDDDNLSTVQLTVNNGALSVTLSGTASISAGANDSSDLTLSGSLSDINAALATVSYQGGLNYNGSDTLTVLSTDTDSATDSDTVAIMVNAVNDNPTNEGTLPGDIIVTEDVASNVDLSVLNLSDVDAGSGSLIVTLSTSTGGQLSLAADGALSFGGTDSARTVTGTVANLNAYFDVASNVQYVHGTANTNGNDADTIQVVINDQGNTGSGGGTDQALGTVNVDITAVNDEQVLVTNAGVTVAEGSTGTVITAAMLNTTDVDNTAAQLVYTIDTAVVNGTLRLSGSALGLNDTFTQADVDAGDVSYDHDDSQTSSDAFAFTVDDGTGTDTSGTFSITVTNVNDAPVNTVPGAQTVDEDTPLAIAGISVADDDDNLSAVQLTVNNGELSVSLAGGATISGGSNDSSTLTLSGTQVQINSALATLAYQGDLNFNGSDTLTVLSTDNSAATTNDTVSITVNAVNDNPTNAGTLPSDIAVTEDVSSNVDLSSLNLSDVDAGSGDLIVTLATATGGQLSLAADGALSFGGTDSARTVTGTVSNLNAYFDVTSNVQYVHGTANTNGNDADTIQVLVNDQGNTGSSGVTNQDLGTVNVDITAVNDEEVLATNLGMTVAEGSTDTTITTAMLQTIDVDNTNAELVYTINTAVVNGTLRLASTALELNDTFTQADVDAGDVSYDHDGSQTSSDSLTFMVDDGTGTVTQATLSITVTNVNNAPLLTNVEPAPLTYVENDGAVSFVQDVIISDVDHVTLESATVAISSNYLSNEDILDVTEANGITGSWNDNTGELILTGSAALLDYQQVLRSVTYANTSDDPSTNERTISVTINDGLLTSDVVTRDINIVAQNDNPVITSDDNLVIPENQFIVFPVIATDAEYSQLTYTISNGTDEDLFVIGSDSGVLSFLEEPDFENPRDANGDNNYEVTLQVTDGFGGIDNQTMMVTVTNVNEAPTANNVILLGIEDTSLFIDIESEILQNDSDPESESLSFSDFTQADNGNLSQLSPTTLLYQPDPDFNGLDRFDYIVEDIHGVQSTATVWLNIESVNDVPELEVGNGNASVDINVIDQTTISNGFFELAENSPYDIYVSANDRDGDALTYSLSGIDAKHYQIDIQSGEITYVNEINYENPLDSNQDNVYEIDIIVEDTNGEKLFVPVSISVLNVNEPPALVKEVFTINEGYSGSLGKLTAFDEDLGDVLEFKLSNDNNSSSSLSNIQLLKDGQINTTGLAAGTYTLEVIVEDQEGLSSLGIIEIVVIYHDDNEPALEAANESSSGKEIPPMNKPLLVKVGYKASSVETNKQVEQSVSAKALFIDINVNKFVELDERFDDQNNLNASSDTNIISKNIGIDLNLNTSNSFAENLVNIITSELPPTPGQILDAIEQVRTSISEYQSNAEVDEQKVYLVVSVGGIVFTVGFAGWLLASRVFLAATMSTVSLWKTLDPIPVLLASPHDNSSAREIDDIFEDTFTSEKNLSGMDENTSKGQANGN